MPSSHRCCQAASAPDHHDLLRFHPRCRAADHRFRPVRQRGCRWALRFLPACWQQRYSPFSWCRSCSLRSTASSPVFPKNSRPATGPGMIRRLPLTVLIASLFVAGCAVGPITSVRKSIFRKAIAVLARKIPRPLRWLTATGARYLPILPCSLDRRSFECRPGCLARCGPLSAEAEALAGVSRAPPWPQAS